MRAVRSLVTVASAVGLFLVRYWSPVARLLFRWFVAKPYEFIWRSTRTWHKLVQQLKPGDLIRRRSTVLYLALTAMLAVGINSYHIRNAVAEDFGRHNLIFPLIQQSAESDTQLDMGEPNTEDEAIDPTLPLTEGGIAILKPYLAVTQPGVAGRNRIEYHTVTAGETLSGIAQRYGLSLTTLLWENRLTANSLIRIGQRLTILPVDGISYRIGKGDTVAKIAQRYRVAATEISNFNRLGQQLTVGQTIIIPGGRPLMQPTPPRSSPKVSKPVTPLVESVIKTAQFLWPTVRRRITQYYSWRHTGIDIADQRGTAIYAADDGIVQVAGWNRGGYGYYIILDHGGGLSTLYGHASKLLVDVGERVGRGQHIANMGSTGRSTGPHLHFEVRVNGRRVNPLNYIR